MKSWYGNTLTQLVPHFWVFKPEIDFFKLRLFLKDLLPIFLALEWKINSCLENEMRNEE
jgi:hypothetical protein